MECMMKPLDNLVDEIYELNESEEHRGAMRLCRCVVDAYPDECDAWLAYSRTLYLINLQQVFWPDLLEWVRQAPIDDEIDPAPRYSANVRDEIIRACRRAVDLDAEYDEAWEELGSMLYVLDVDLVGAVAALERSIDLGGPDRYRLGNLGSALKELRRFDEARAVQQRLALIDEEAGQELLGDIEYWQFERDFE